jgi:chromosome segregation ATPase
VDSAQTELWRVQERAANIGRRLLEHRAGVLGAALAEAERSQEHHGNAMPDTSGLRSSLLSPSGSAHKFDGAHLFAGHEGAVVPGKQPRGAASGSDGASQKEIEELEAKLAAAEARAQEHEAELEEARMAAADLEYARAAAAEELADARDAAESELERERTELQRERERVAQLERRVTQFEQELESSSRGRKGMTQLEGRIRTLERELSDTEGRARTEAEDAAATWAMEKASWESERAGFEQELARLAELSETLESEREQWEQEREELTARAKDQIADAAKGLRSLVQRYDIPLFSRDSGLAVLIDALGRYLEKHNAKVVEQLLSTEIEKRTVVTQELEVAKGEVQDLQARSPVSDSLAHRRDFSVEPITFHRAAPCRHFP